MAPAGPGDAVAAAASGSAADPADLASPAVPAVIDGSAAAAAASILLARLAQLARLQAMLPSSLMLVALLLTPAQVQLPGGRCCMRQLLHFHLQQLHFRLPRALLYLRLP
jgi:hypothetical protein